jgi:hypothetical protein
VKIILDNIVIVTTDTVVVGFINSSNELEYTEYKAYDGGFIELDSTKTYTKEDLIKLLASFVNLNEEEIDIIS